MDLDAEIETRLRRPSQVRSAAKAASSAINAWYDVELTYTSNAIEGSTSRVAYLDALHVRQVEKRASPWEHFMRQQLIASLDTLLAHLERGHGA
jgi:hypothetical protein